MSVPSFPALCDVNRMQSPLIYRSGALRDSLVLTPVTSLRETAIYIACQPTLDGLYVRVATNDAGPVHALQRPALCSAVACAKFRERVPAARVHSIRELVHAIARLHVRRQSTHAHKSAKCRVQASTHRAGCLLMRCHRHNRTRKETTSNHRSPRVVGLPQPARTAQSPSAFAQMVTMHLFGSSDSTQMGKSSLS